MKILFLLLFFSGSISSIASEIQQFEWLPRQPSYFALSPRSLVSRVPELQGKLNKISKRGDYRRSVVLEGESLSLRLGGEKLTRKQQTHLGVKVDGAFHSELRQRRRLVYSKGAFFNFFPNALAQQIKKMRSQGPKESKDRLIALFRPSLILSSELRILEETSDFEVYWRISFVNETETGAYEAFFDHQAEIKKIRPLSLGVHSGVADVYPKGPHASPLTTVQLENLLGDGWLANSFLKIVCSQPQKAFSRELYFKYPIKDSRFDEVQTYYFADYARDWFKTKLKTSLSHQLEIKVHVGEKSNAAFYAAGKVFLGNGDGVQYKELMRDPTVVIHEIAHAYIDEIASLPPRGEGGSLNEGFADGFTAYILGHPHMGEHSFLGGKYRRTLENQLKYSDRRGRLYEDSLIVSGTLWELREVLGERRSSQLALRTLARLGPTAELSDFGTAVLLAGDQFLNAGETQRVIDILRSREWI